MPAKYAARESNKVCRLVACEMVFRQLNARRLQIWHPVTQNAPSGIIPAGLEDRIP